MSDAREQATDHTEARHGAWVAQAAAPLRSFLATESGSAGLLLIATLIAVVWANSGWSESYFDLWATELSVQLGEMSLSMDLKHWVDDGLMVLFFFVIGLELRREISMGELTDRRRMTVPGIAAIGGVLVPAGIFLALNSSGDAANGWGIVIATDTAFLLGVLALVGPACPTQLRVFLLTLSIADDVIAVTVIGLGYSDALDLTAIAVAAAALLAIWALGRLDVWRTPIYALFGVIAWVATVESGLHPSLIGVLGGMLITAHPPDRERVEDTASMFQAFRQSPMPSTGWSAALSLRRAVSLNERLQTHLHPLTSYVIVPVFALANAGVDLRDGVLGEALSSSLTWGVIAGLVAGKLIGVGFGALGGVRLGMGALPQGVGHGQVLGGAALSGIGFTVSLLIAGLAFSEPGLEDQAKVGVLIAAVLAALIGWLIFWAAAVFRGERSAGLPMYLNRPIDPERDHIRGPIDAPMTLVEYGDFECPFCSRATGVIHELTERFGDELRYVFRHLPLEDVHPNALLAAEASEAAARQGRFWEMHDMLFRYQDHLEFHTLVRYANNLDLDVSRFMRELDEGEHGRRIREDLGDAELSGARGTPTFFIGERRHVGPWDTESLAAALLASRDGGSPEPPAAEAPGAPDPVA